MGQNLLAVSSFKREHAQKLDVDVYSSNQILQKELNSLASASAAGITVVEHAGRRLPLLD